MWKVLILVVVLAVPILCSPIDGAEEKPAFEKYTWKDTWKEICKNVTGVDVDIDRHNRLKLEFNNCKINAMDQKELSRDFEVFSRLNQEWPMNSSFSNQEKDQMVNFSRKYCPKMEAIISCNKILQPIYNECYDTDERLWLKVEKEIYQRIHNFFCKNESEQVISFIDGKVIECGMEKRVEVAECYHNYELSRVHVDTRTSGFLEVEIHFPFVDFLRLPKADTLCREIDNLNRCSAPIFEQCELSQTAGELVKSMFTDLLTGTSCTNFINRN